MPVVGGELACGGGGGTGENTTLYPLFRPEEEWDGRSVARVELLHLTQHTPFNKTDSDSKPGTRTRADNIMPAKPNHPTFPTFTLSIYLSYNPLIPLPHLLMCLHHPLLPHPSSPLIPLPHILPKPKTLPVFPPPLIPKLLIKLLDCPQTTHILADTGTDLRQRGVEMAGV